MLREKFAVEATTEKENEVQTLGALQNTVVPWVPLSTQQRMDLSSALGLDAFLADPSAGIDGQRMSGSLLPQHHLTEKELQQMKYDPNDYIPGNCLPRAIVTWGPNCREGDPDCHGAQMKIRQVVCDFIADPANVSLLFGSEDRDMGAKYVRDKKLRSPTSYMTEICIQALALIAKVDIYSYKVQRSATRDDVEGWKQIKGQNTHHWMHFFGDIRFAGDRTTPTPNAIYLYNEHHIHFCAVVEYPLQCSEK